MNVRFNIPWGEVVTFIHVVKLYANESFILVCCKYMIKTPRLRGFFSFENIINVDNVSKSVNVTVWSIVSIGVLWLLKLIWFYSLFFLNLFIWLHWVLVAACELLVAAYDIKFPDQGLNPGPMLWEHRVLATGPPGKSLTSYSLLWSTWWVIGDKAAYVGDNYLGLTLTEGSLRAEFCTWKAECHFRSVSVTLLQCHSVVVPRSLSHVRLCNLIECSMPG